MEAIGGIFLSSALGVLFDRLASKGDLLNMFQKRKDDARLLDKLTNTLLGLQAVLSDAENKQASNPSVSQWLNKLRDAVDSAENLIEQVNYEALRHKVEGKKKNLAQTLLKHCTICSLCVRDDFFLNIKDKLEETIETLKDLQEQIGDLGLNKHDVPTKQEPRTPSTSLVDDSDIVGRQNEIKDLIDRLLSEDANGKNLAVVPIVGMGGLGKTTLAKAVYNDERVKNHFPLKAWYCVSEAYDSFRITKGLLQEIGAFDPKDDNNLNQLQVKLKETLKGKKFLVVLDDVWNDNYNGWVDLRNCFVQGAMGSKIIITTRKESVALMMGNDQISMDNLSIEVSWSLFKRHAFENRDPMEHPELEDVGKQIAAKCKGLPLALKTLAGMLRSKSEAEEWKRVLRSQIWELPHNDILPALMLSYNDLPPDLKPCFAFCAIYPKDYQFCKDQVIYLWIANGLVEQFHSGNQYFMELISRSLFERVPEGFLMHDLVNDLAQIASSNLCIRLEESQGSRMLELCRHMSYSMGVDGDFEKLKPIYKLEQLRTLLPIRFGYFCTLGKRALHNILPRLISLRALSLSHYQIDELPDELFIKLKLLRFLDLSETRIKKLPESICVLYYLETLLLSSCADLEELPLQMERLINLHHLDISNTPRLKMPLHLSKLKSLQVLVGAKFLVGVSRMEDLGDAQNLYGSLSVLELQNVFDRRGAAKAKTREKNHVDKLSLEWAEGIAKSSQTERDILDELCPHESIKELQIIGYRGTNFSNWVGDPLFLKLVKLSLNKCKNCYSLPALGELPSLKILSIRGMDGVTEVTKEFYGSSSSKKPFNSLEKLEFEDMLEWKQWHALDFPKLEILSIENCAKLMGKLPENLCSLKELKISRCPALRLETAIQLSSLKRFQVKGCPETGGVFDEAQLFTCQLEGMKQIEELYISYCSNLKWLPDRMQELLPSLESLYLSHCPEIESFPEGGLPFNLQVLCIANCTKLVNRRKEWRLPCLRDLWIFHDMSDEEILGWELPSSIQTLMVSNLKTLSSRLLKSLTSLEYLHIEGNVPQIQSLLEQGQLPSSLSELHLYEQHDLHSLGLCHLSSLQSLCISNCRNLQSLSGSSLPSSLSRLNIYNCPNLQSLPVNEMPSSLSKLDIDGCPLLTPQLEFDKGEYWPNIAHIPNIIINDEWL